jgi:hypothetical protein
MIKRAVHIDTKTHAVKGVFLDLAVDYERYRICQSFDVAEVPFGGGVCVFVDQMAAYRIGQTWCTVGVFPLPLGGQVLFFERDEDGEIVDFMRTEAFFNEFINWITPAEAQLFLLSNNLVPPQSFETLVNPVVSQMRVVK